MSTANVLQKVDIATLKEGDSVFLSAHDWKEVGLSKIPQWHNKTAVFIKHSECSIKVLLDDDSFWLDREWVYYPPAIPSAPQSEQPVLITLGALGRELRGRKMHELAEDMCNYFSRPENQYQPLVTTETVTPPADEWVPEIGDRVIPHQFYDGDIFFREPMLLAVGTECVITEISKEYKDRCNLDQSNFVWPLSSLTLVKKAFKIRQSMVSSEQELNKAIVSDTRLDKPFPLDVARKLYKEGGTGKEVVQQWYMVDQLEEKQLPMSWEGLGTISGYFITEDSLLRTVERARTESSNANVYPTRLDAEAALVTAQLLQLRKVWLEIAAPDWVPDWSVQNEVKKWVIRRHDSTAVCITANAYYSPFSFPTKELATRFLASFPALLNTTFCLSNEKEEVV